MSIQPTKEMAAHCFDLLVSHLTGISVPIPSFPNPPVRLIIQWKKTETKGNIVKRGTSYCTDEMPLHAALALHVIESATKSKTQPPITRDEVTSLIVEISIFKTFEIADIQDWEIGKHGIQIQFTHEKKRLQATYSPAHIVEKKWTKERCIQALIKKAGYEPLILKDVGFS
eukprot:TRINITY_DN2461_c0_g2_i2.p1 TRINITY_DN2461_c0_g2~~TRINITY_DN2461_c0_g2_i2.p1  ORF type:complete len:171 (-),score=32.05 TRINITY_DN2461_c0_g2_i2:388-900(-)